MYGLFTENGYENKREADFTDSVGARLCMYCIGETYEVGCDVIDTDNQETKKIH